MQTVLLVDDTESLRKLAFRVLAKEGFDVVGAADGEEALKVAKARGKPFDLLITDLTMPGMGGRQLAVELRRQHPNQRVLFMSGTEEALDMSVIVDGVRTWWLSKPFNPVELVALARESLKDLPTIET